MASYLLRSLYNRSICQLLSLIFFSLLLACVHPSQAQKKAALPNRFPEPRFEHIGLKDGLPENSVLCILQDRFGFLWLGTQNGLAKYDGYSMIVYQPEPGNPASISDHTINAIYEDRGGTLWIGTYYGGLNKFDRGSETFTRYLNNTLDSSSIGSNQVICIYEDNADRLWVGTTNGLSQLDRSTNRFNHYYSQDWLLGPEAYEYLSGLTKTGRQVSSILKVGDNANASKGFALKQKTDVLLAVMGEGVADYGWLESENGSIIATYDSAKTLGAGGWSDNRVLMKVIALNSGRYWIRYKSDQGHSYNSWQGSPPTHPEFWGIQVFDISGEVEKTRQMLDSLQPMNLTRRVNAVVEDQQTGNLYVGGVGGLWTFDVNRKVLSKGKLPDNDPIISQAFMRALHLAKDGTLWIASESGLSRYDPRTNTSKLYQVIPSTTYVRENSFGSLLEDPTGLIWAGHYWVHGLESFDPQTEQFRPYAHDSADPFSLSFSRGVWSLHEDRSGVVLVGSWLGGLDKWDRKKRQFNTVEIDPDHLAPGIVNSIYEDPVGRILVGTNVGLVQLDERQKGSSNYLSIWGKGHGRNEIWRIIEDPVERGVLWLSCLDSGLIKLDSKRNLTTRYRNDPHDTNSLSSGRVGEILVDHDGVLWVGTEAGLNRFDRATGRFSRFQHDLNDSTSLSQNQIRFIYEDRSGVLWVGTNVGGLNRFDRKTEKFTSWKSLVPGREFTSVFSIHEDKQGNFWIGEYMTGMHLFDRQTGKAIQNFTEKDGLSNNSVAGFFEDESGHLWISTDNGLSRFDFGTRTFKNYWVEDGLPDNFLGRGLKTRDGRIILGGNKGVTVFHPDSIKDDPVAPQVVVSSVSLFNRPNEKLAFDGYVPELKEIGLSHSQNDLRFDFVGLQFSEPAKNKYKYILENFDRDWVDAGTQRNATYTNLDPGEYIFKVKAANRDGIWNEEGASIRIMITPPWWKTIWAYLGYVFVIVGLFYTIRRSEKNRDRLKHQAELEHVEAEKLREVDQMKSRFFANISHEFRTPLTLILGPVEELQSAVSDEKSKQKLSMMQRNAQRLLRLINQLLDLSKLEGGAMKLRASRMNIVPFVKGLASSFESSADMRRVAVSIHADRDEIDVYFDKDKMEKIITNLLSNAFKFTPDGGEVSVLTGLCRDVQLNVPTKGECVAISVADTGIGVPADELSRVFDRFYQVDSSQTREHEGSGIGLALTKELVELHHGTISVKSEVGKGTEFAVMLPLGRDHLKGDEVVEEGEPQPTAESLRAIPTGRESEAIPHMDQIASARENVPRNDTTPLVLVVEDNADVRAYMREYLVTGYEVQEAHDGAEGIEKAKESIPDLIISDVMMPKQDGYELCKALKLDEKTSHIPIILLTAKAGTENRIEGLETGADDYLTKPFDARELLVRVKNLIDLRWKLRERFSVGQVLKPGDIAVTSIDDSFLQKAIAVVEKRMGDEEFGVEQFRNELGMSRTQLHRKLTALTNQSTSDFVRYMRLQRAKALLTQNAGTVSEIAYQVGFNSVAYFTKCFREQFGIVPSEVRPPKA